MKFTASAVRYKWLIQPKRCMQVDESVKRNRIALNLKSKTIGYKLRTDCLEWLYFMVFLHATHS